MTLWTRLSTIAAVALAAAACGQHPDATAPARTTDTSTSPSAGAAATPVAAAAAAQPPLAPCSVLTAAEVGTILGKSVVAQASGNDCEYALDPSVHEAPAVPPGHAKEGSLPDLMSALGKGGDFSKLAGAISQQLQVTVSFARDAMTEDQIRSIYARTGSAVRAATQPEPRLGAVIRTGDDIPGVGEWAFATNVASVQMGGGFSSRGRILQTRRGPWHLTVLAVVSPDPGPETLDRQLASIARTAFTRLPT